MDRDYYELRDRLFSTLSSALESLGAPSAPAESSPPVGSPASSEEQGASRSSPQLDEVLSRLGRIESRLDDLESVLLDIVSRVSSSSPSDQYIMDIYERIQHVHTLVLNIAKNLSNSSGDDLSEIKAALDAIRSDINKLSGQLKGSSGSKARQKKSTRPKAEGGDVWSDLL